MHAVRSLLATATALLCLTAVGAAAAPAANAAGGARGNTPYAITNNTGTVFGVVCQNCTLNDKSGSLKPGATIKATPETPSARAYLNATGINVAIDLSTGTCEALAGPKPICRVDVENNSTALNGFQGQG
ncbi:hypothetical protein [Streptomyces sp. NRRL F-2664]|uniref:hypothetical protein n=1 Tax=Streptomyces sp. NRRL F-2664 TaxID=1463842 RepID=UPI00131B26B8|nr:hypothetical protein [Streptomyces sp. NRRL F-2664]